ncbi:MAG: zinc-binding dehydrogenase [Gammaproteobacteria bacterium]|nr:zinc-binding dehydrogenase [Gammaproteobacteria bacterium]
MKGLTLLRNGTTEDLEVRDDLAIPFFGDDEVLVKVSASTLNRVDQVLIRGYPGLALNFPQVLGADIAGEIAEMGKNVSGWKRGDKVSVYPLVACQQCALCQEGKPNLCEHFNYFGMHRPGGYAEYVPVPARNLASLPAGVDAAAAASIGVAGITALHALNMNNDLKPGSSLMIWGATGGVGTLMIQLAKLRGLEVIATTRQQDQAETLGRLGADHILDSNDEKIMEKVGALYPSGVDQVIDYVGPATFPTSFQLLKKGGTMTLCGILTGMETTLSIHQTYFRHLRIQGVYLGTEQEYHELLALLAAKSITVPIAARHPLSTGKQALQDFGHKNHLGKVIIEAS